ncbi:VirB4 family type IV secretion system protein [Metallosphaera sedula]|uniref:VirB4 family type IV secretion system protein n=1 Tax=Metallosphaera sedula TaxID=43687 RepID=UPI0020C097C9|nr:hypothetical protein [Metallosphaera sedula]BBL48323.1 hypothetical protein MJ1HA_2445 [Metallosphaera sedula]
MKAETQQKEKASWYQLQGIPFGSLNEGERDSVLAQFSAMFSSIEEGKLLIQNREEPFEYEGETFNIMRTSFFLQAKREVPYFQGSPGTPVRPRVVREKFNHVELEDGRKAQVSVVYFFPRTLPEGFLYSFFSLVDEIVITWKTLRKNQAMSLIDSSRKRKESLLMDSKSGKLERETSSLSRLATKIMGGADLVEFYVYMIYAGFGTAELKEKFTEVKDTAKFFGLEVEVPHFYQRALYELKTSRDSFIPFMNSIEKKYIDTESMRPFFPLISEEVVEEGGVFLGVSGTGNRIVYNPYTKINYNVVILGESGSGKSMTNKILQRRYYTLHRDWPLLGFDPENEYVKPGVSDSLGAIPVEIDLKSLEEGGEGLGLDPIRMYHEGILERDESVSLLNSFYPLKPEQGLQIQKYVYTFETDSIFDFIRRIPDQGIREVMEIADVPPDRTIFSGELRLASKRIIFGLRKIGTMSKRSMDLVSALLSAYSYNELIARAGSKGGIIFVDEAWRFAENPAVLSLFENVARRGRKYGLIFTYISQRVNDLASSPRGRTILEQSATTILLHHDETSKDTLHEIYKISDWEFEYLKKANPGEGFLRMKTTSGEYRMAIHVLPTQEELQLFSTSPVGAISNE